MDIGRSLGGYPTHVPSEEGVEETGYPHRCVPWDASTVLKEGDPLQIVRLTAADIYSDARPRLILLLQDAVDGCASLGFWPPLDGEEARDYWREVAAEVEKGTRVVLAAWEGRELAGSVQLAFSPKPNGRHRAEVQKLCVRSDFRNRGIGRALMDAAEDAALAAGKTLLVLDTRRGDVAEGLYERLGYVRAGIIPEFTITPDSDLQDTVIFYKRL
jgi:ribosomal protein S18 acetylase RimI-like enzyme